MLGAGGGFVDLIFNSMDNSWVPFIKTDFDDNDDAWCP
jgi:hypothetical protein